MSPTIKKLFVWGNVALVVLLVLSVIRDQSGEWKKYQKTYYQLEAKELETKLAATTDETEKESLKKQIRAKEHAGLEIKQFIVKDLGRIDRCVTCHVGMDPLFNPTLTNNFTEQPYKAHPGDFLKTHSPTKYGCTVCHQGQGLATTVKDAHGFVEAWEKPMLGHPFIQASCAKCHQNFESLPGAEVAAAGRGLFVKNGCYGCHAVKGWGGVISEDLGEVADKPLARIDPAAFAANGLPRERWSAQSWITLHLTKDPMSFVPGDPEGHMSAPISPSGMPPFYLELKEDEAKAITTYLLSLTAEKESLPHKFFVDVPVKPEPAFKSATEHGKFVFQKFGCAGCHGVEAKAGRRNFNALGPNQTKMEDGREPTLPDTVGTFTRDELRAKIQNGVPSVSINKFKTDGPTPPLYMPSWKEKIKGQELEDLISYLLSIAKKTEEW